MARYARIRYQGKAVDARVKENRLEVLEGSWMSPESQPTGITLAIDGASFLAPVEPRTILCVGRNYRDHARELGNDVPTEPLFFLKQLGALTAHQAPVYRPTFVGRVDFEGELVAVFGRTLPRGADLREIRTAIVGYTVGNDITARELQNRDGQWTRAKGFDSFAPVGPWVDTDFVPQGQRLTTRVNGEIRQDAPLSEMVFSVEQQMVAASRFMTFHAGDILFTGTPSGIGPVEDGDEVSVTIENLGTLSNSIKNRD